MHHSSRRRRPVRKRSTQAIQRALLSTRNPTRPEGTLSRCAAAMGFPRLIRSPLEPRGSLPFNTKNKRRTREKEQGRDVKTRIKSSILICRLCVVQSAITSHLFMRRLDFPYKKMTKNSVQNIKNPNLTRTEIFGNFPDQLGLTNWFASVLPRQHCQLSSKFSDQLGLTDQLNSVGPK